MDSLYGCQRGSRLPSVCFHSEEGSTRGAERASQHLRPLAPSSLPMNNRSQLLGAQCGVRVMCTATPWFPWSRQTNFWEVKFQRVCVSLCFAAGRVAARLVKTCRSRSISTEACWSPVHFHRDALVRCPFPQIKRGSCDELLIGKTPQTGIYASWCVM